MIAVGATTTLNQRYPTSSAPTSTCADQTSAGHDVCYRHQLSVGHPSADVVGRHPTSQNDQPMLQPVPVFRMRAAPAGHPAGVPCQPPASMAHTPHSQATAGRTTAQGNAQRCATGTPSVPPPAPHPLRRPWLRSTPQPATPALCPLTLHHSAAAVALRGRTPLTATQRTMKQPPAKKI
jgi:hypothetical protein